MNGYGLETATSVYRRIELLDTGGATNLVGTTYEGPTPVAPGGRLVAGIKPATLTSFIDINDNAQLRKFGLHNGEPNDRNNLSEKWESLALLPVLDPARPNDFFLFVANDNDFMTQNGYQAGAAYKDASGVDIDSMFLVYRDHPGAAEIADISAPSAINLIGFGLGAYHPDASSREKQHAIKGKPVVAGCADRSGEVR